MTKRREWAYEMEDFEQHPVYLKSTKNKIAQTQLKIHSKQVMIFFF